MPDSEDEREEDRDEDEEDYGACGKCCCLGWPICCLCRKICVCANRCLYASGLKCCCCDDTSGKLFLSIQKTGRYPTDILWCLLLILALIIQFSVFMSALSNGNVESLVYFSDYNGTICGPSNDELNYRELIDGRLANETNGTVTHAGDKSAWPDIRMYQIRICVEKCNQTVFDDRVVTPSFDSDLNADYFNYTSGKYIDISGYKTVSVFDAYCIPDPNGSFISYAMAQADNAFSKSLDSLSQSIDIAIYDLNLVWPFFFLCAGTGLAFSFLYGVSLRYIADLLIWVSVALIMAGLFLLSYFMVDMSEEAYTFGYDTTGDFLYYGGICVGIIAFMYLLAVLFMIPRIRLAIALAKETTRALGQVWKLFFYPIPVFVVLLGYLAYWIIAAVWIISVTEKYDDDFPLGIDEPYYEGGKTLREALHLTDDDKLRHIKVVDSYKVAAAFHFFMVLWVVCFINYFSHMVISSIFAEWYFAHWESKDEEKKIRGDGKNEFSNSPLTTAAWRVIKYHLGTVAFASFLIAMIEFAEYSLTYFEKQLIGEDPSPLQKAILNAIKCCLRCLRWLMDKINRNGMIITAIYGWPLCAASQKGIALIFKNIIRAAALDMVAGYLTKIGQATIILFNTGLFVMIIRLVYGDELTSVILPGMVCFIISFGISYQYMDIFEAGLDTIFICFLVDESKNSGGNMLASDRLLKLIGEQKVSKKKAFEMALAPRNEGHVGQKQRKFFKSQTHLNLDVGDDDESSMGAADIPKEDSDFNEDKEE